MPKTILITGATSGFGEAPDHAYLRRKALTHGKAQQ
jgi:NADP-dependent 3-hydroxy acid dehydrogenase YdfG